MEKELDTLLDKWGKRIFLLSKDQGFLIGNYDEGYINGQVWEIGDCHYQLSNIIKKIQTRKGGVIQCQKECDIEKELDSLLDKWKGRSRLLWKDHKRYSSCYDEGTSSGMIRGLSNCYWQLFDIVEKFKQEKVTHSNVESMDHQ